MEALLAKARAELGVDTPTVQHLMRIAVTLAQDANRLPGLRGRERLELVLKVLRDLIATVPEEARAPLTTVIDSVIPETVTLVVEASRGSFDLKKPSVGCIARIAVALCRSAAAVAPPAVALTLRQAADAGEKVAELAAAPPAEASTTIERPPEPTSAPAS